MNKRKYRNRLRRLLGRRLLIILLILLQIFLLSVMLFRSYQFYWLSAICNLVSIGTALYLMMGSEKTDFKLSLVFLLLLFPLFGGIFYWVFHFQTASVGFRKRVDALLKEQRKDYASVKQSSTVAEDALPKDKRLLRYLSDTAAFPAFPNTSVRYFGAGRDMLDAMLEDMRHAEHYIFLEYFIIEEGVMWDSILAVLKEKASQGIDVRVIYDDFGSLLTLPANYCRTLRDYGIKCHIFNRFLPMLSTVQNNRDHRKITVIDGKIAYTGGINLADEYINERIRFGKWKDNSVRLCGEAASSFALMFLQMWNSVTKTAEKSTPFLPFPPHVQSADGWVQPYADTPIDGENVSEQVYLHAIERTQKYLYITTPYLMVGDELISALNYAAKSGVDVRIITPGKPDKPMVHFTTRSYYRELIGAGIKIYEFSDGFMHAKTFISDGDLAIVGTVNMDFRSLYLHYECGTCLYHTNAITDIHEDFQKTLSRCRQMTASDCRSNLIIRLMQNICRLLAPLM